MASNVEEWCTSELSKLLKTPSEEIARYIVSITNEHDLETILNDVLVGVSDTERSEFVNSLKSKTNCARGYRKWDLTDEKQDNLSKKNASSKKKNKNHQEQENTPSTASLEKKAETVSAPTHRKKPHFVSIYSPEGWAKDVLILPGRNPCTCLASKHGLINNCLNCGRIVCKQEGSGPCFTCGEWVGTPEEKERRKKLGLHVQESKTSRLEDENLNKAREERDRLLAYSENYEQGTKVIDDQTDFYTTDMKWLSAEEKEAARKMEELREQQKAARKTKKITLDFAGRKVIECEDVPNPYYAPLQDIIPKKPEGDTKEVSNVAPNFEFEPPMYIGNSDPSKDKVKKAANAKEVGFGRNVRLQDTDLQLMRDEGLCLSLHQPWASLLITGIRLHEGRSWYTPHRGCLWIHAAKKEPTQSDIKEIEANILLDKPVVFPKDYPTSCLLGCVTVVDCLPQEEYRIQYPYGQSGSPYVFICENPQELMLKLPMSGKHKIFKLDSNIHYAAKKTLKKTPAKD